MDPLERRGERERGEETPSGTHSPAATDTWIDADRKGFLSSQRRRSEIRGRRQKRGLSFTLYGDLLLFVWADQYLDTFEIDSIVKPSGRGQSNRVG